MRKTLLIAAFLVPFAAFALDYSNTTERYSDAPFSKAETAGISLLTNAGALEGNPDGTFRPARLLNRAEFLKIVLASADISTSPDNPNCFPDVRSSDWFSQYVCEAKERGIVQGNPDGYFRPARNVNLAEAVKMLVETWDLTLPVYIRAPDHWYDPYFDAANSAGIPVSRFGAPDHQLTRGEMARLAASFLAYDNGELDDYLDAERGVFHSSSSSVSSSSSSTASSTSSNSSSSSSTSSVGSSSSSSSSMSTVAGFPARSHFLVAGERSQAVGSAAFFANLEPLYVRGAQVKMMTKIEGIDSMYIVDNTGTQLGQIFLDKVFDPSEKTWRGTFATTSGSYKIPKGEQRVLGIELRMKPRNQGGTSEEMVQVDGFTITTEGEWTQNSASSVQNVIPYPKHQTAMGRITSVTNAIAETEALPLGSNNILAAFRITGSAVDGASLRIEHLQFQVSKSSSVNISNWRLSIPDTNESWPCSINDTTVSCTSIPASLGTLGTGQSSRVFRLFGDVTLSSGSTDKNLQISLNLAGSVDELGAVRWTDESGHYNWVELDSPLARSTRFF
jgi:hypothetical protein